MAIQEAFDFNNDHLYCFFMDNNPGKTFLYLFDYGDEWEFKVEVEEVDADKPLPLKPRLVAKRGEAPEQYHNYYC